MNVPQVIALSLLGAIAALFFGEVFNSAWPVLCNLPIAAKETKDGVTWCAEFWINRYQTLIAAIIALAAAGISVLFVKRQIFLAEIQEVERYLRRNAAARAVLPLSLSSICNYAERSAAVLKEMLDEFDAPRTTAWYREERHPEPPTEAIAEIRELIETIEVSRSVGLSRIMQEIQVHNARVKGALRDRRFTDNDLREYILDAVEIYGRASLNFDYARGEVDYIRSSISNREVKSFCRILRVSMHDGDEIFGNYVLE